MRRSLLEAATKTVQRDGFADLSLRQVAAEAGVTKGGLLHHFGNKQELLDALVAHLIGALDAKIDALMERDEVAKGSFTRAYVEISSEYDSASMKVWSAALGSSPEGAEGTNQLWASWLAARLKKHARTDGGEKLEIVRLAADGMWFALANGSQTPAQLLRAKKALTRMTHT